MTKRIVLSVLCLLMLVPAARAQTSADYEISSYVLYVSVQPDGSANIREEIIFSCTGAYSGIERPIVPAADGEAYQFEAWADSKLLTESTDADHQEGTFSLSGQNGETILSIHSPGSNDWRAFACAYTLDNVALRYEDTGLIDCTLIPENHDALYQNATIIVTFPQADGEILAYASGAMNADSILTQYDRVSFGPMDVPADAQVSVKLLFPSEWLSEAQTIPQAVREPIVSGEEEKTEKIERENSALRLGKIIALGAYVAVFGGLCLLLMKKYGVRRKSAVSADESALDHYPAALAGYVAEDAADTDGLAGALAELAQRGCIDIGFEKRGPHNELVMRLNSRPAGSAHHAAAVSWLFAGGDTLWIADLTSDNDYERAQKIERGYNAYCAAVADDAAGAGLRWKNENWLILFSSLEILCGLVLAFVMILLGESLIIEAGLTTVAMFIMMKQYDRVRHLTDEGEKLKAAAASFGGMRERGAEELASRLPVSVALGKANLLSGDDGKIYQALTEALRASHVHNASLRRPKGKRPRR